MPITTALAAVLVSKMSGRQLESADAHGHTH
jgi:hypothetical protein